VTSWHQLIRREVIFKEPSVVTADPLTLSLRFAAMTNSKPTKLKTQAVS
jgi:hypothetical protein